MTNPLIDIFVYGTLKPNYWAYQRFCAGLCRRIQAAIVPGSLYHLPLGYPAMTIARPDCVTSGLKPISSVVHGFVLSFDDAAILVQLDDYENHDRGEIEQRYPGVAIEAVSYQRSETPVFQPNGLDLGRAWVYAMQLEQIQQLEGIPVPDGNWLL